MALAGTKTHGGASFQEAPVSGERQTPGRPAPWLPASLVYHVRMQDTGHVEREAQQALADALAGPGFAFVQAADMRARLEAVGPLGDWDAFAASWDRLELDNYMADHGRYRRRRHAVYAAAAGAPVIQRPAQPHYQSLEYNTLNGGIARWFAPVEPTFAAGPALGTVLAFCRGLFERLAGECPWHIELHQFRIEAGPGMEGLPTPEGMHRDGVDYVLVLLVHRQNIDRGTTLIGAPDGSFTDSFTLATPFDAALLDDHRVYHGVTPVQAKDPATPAHRDVLVVTFRRAS